MRIKFDHALQFKVTLKGIKPPLWRRIVVPCDYTFWDLHVAIQDAMGWLDYHLHAFRIPVPFFRRKVMIGIPDDDRFLEEDPVLPGWMLPVGAYFTLGNRKGVYEYDFGDGWEHEVRLEKILPRDRSVRYPLCTGGRRACPPEDCGGTGGYQEFLAAIADPAHQEHETLLEWAGGSFDPEHFDATEVEFDDPEERRKLAFSPEPGPEEFLEKPPQGGRSGLPAAGGPGPADRKAPILRLETGRGHGWEKAVRCLPQPVEEMRDLARRGFQGFPVATVVLYGPDDALASKVVVGIIPREGADADPLARWYAERGDVRENGALTAEILAFIKENGTRTVILADRILGCPHEEGIDYPAGQVCPECPFWARRDRWSGEPIH